MGSLLAACKDEDDDDDKKVANEFKVNNTTYALTDAYVDSVTTTTVGDKSYHVYNVVIASDGITFSESDKFQGSGDAVRFQVQSTQEGWVPAAQYLPGTSDNILKSALVFVGFGSETPTVYDEEISDGQVTVSKSGEEHVFEFSFTLEDNSTISGSFKGAVTKANSF
ncbi:hypothetical protein DQQ10_16100 [Pseudochryseolinea flava]|uniref:Uncharacterized protein n=2 Tax=Pseudochryseolinea flava TaxID=2059302 RepID=A0A364Y1C1_9BACT|nr:hypothetical protein DQQ10_16100 [Pseudochryseolinea flava]